MRYITQFVYSLILFILYFPMKGVKNVRVAHSQKVLFFGRMINVPVKKLRIGIPIDLKKGCKNGSISLLKSPHFDFACSVLNKKSQENKKSYKKFAVFLSRARDRKRYTSIAPSEYLRNFEKLINNISKNVYSYESMPIIVYPRIWKNDYIIVDGAHRASILAALGKTEIICGVKLWQKSNTYMYKL